MYIFNQGKYKSIHAQQADELLKLRQSVEQDCDFLPFYHLCPKTGLLNDPNGLVFDGDKYHIFYQWFPYDAIHGMKHWQHLITTDFYLFQEADMLIPDEMFESHGCYSGGAILWQDHIVAFYTGNTRRETDNQRVPHQNIAIFDKSGKLLEKRCLIDLSPEGYTEHVRDPKPYITKDGKIRFVIGAQRKKDLSGVGLIYEMDNLTTYPKLIGELSLSHFDNSGVFMWECPDLSNLDGKDILIWSPQGKAQQTFNFQNNYHSVYALGKFDSINFVADYIDELDYGFDFYAPQTITNSNGMMLAWIGLPDLTYPTDKFKWHSMLTLPRQLAVKSGKIYQLPIKEIYHKLSTPFDLVVNNHSLIDNLDIAYLKFNPQNAPFEIRFFENSLGHCLILSYQNGMITLDRSLTEQTSTMENWGGKRHCKINILSQVEIFFDRSVVEIFLNNGEKVMTARFFIVNRKNVVNVSRQLNFSIAYLPMITVTK